MQDQTMMPLSRRGSKFWPVNQFLVTAQQPAHHLLAGLWVQEGMACLGHSGLLEELFRGW